MGPRHRGTVGAWTVSSGRDHASRAQARIVPGNGRRVTQQGWGANGRPERGTPSPAFAADQAPAGYATLQRRLRAAGVPPASTLVVLEATGNYWVALAVALHEAGYRVSVVNPRQAHHFAKAQLRRAKTDALDAQDLARLAAALQPAPWAPPPAVYHEVRQRLVARDGLLAMRTQARNQRYALLQWPVVVAGVRQHLDELIAGCPLGASTGGLPPWRPSSP